MVYNLVDTFIFYSRNLLPNSFLPVLQLPIGVGSAFEGWSPHEEDRIYHLLVPLKPPHGHAFHPELLDAGVGPARNFCIRVEPLCTCTDEQLAEKMLCFLHQPEEELRRNQEPSLRDTLCTGSYLDVHKTARWFHQLVKASWARSPLSSQWHMTLLPSSCSCRFQLAKDKTKRLNIELMFGVRQGFSDIFLSSESTADIFTPSTMWLESYAVAEAAFFRHVATRAPQNSCHLKCLQVCARILVGSAFSTYTLKTVVMHLLTILPVSCWRERDLVPRLQDIMWFLCHCVENKCLNHYFFSNGNVPSEVVLPLALRTAEPLNLFQRLAQDPDAHAEALREFMDLQDR
ncbi:IPIL1 protein, partial [Corythaeola cristata]|nr:IPIL1 protein [Corythaeola cristata]